MKRQTMLQGSEPGESDDGATVMSAEAALQQEIVGLGEWLAAQGFDFAGVACTDAGAPHAPAYDVVDHLLGRKPACSTP